MVVFSGGGGFGPVDGGRTGVVDSYPNRPSGVATRRKPDPLRKPVLRFPWRFGPVDPRSTTMEKLILPDGVSVSGDLWFLADGLEDRTYDRTGDPVEVAHLIEFELSDRLGKFVPVYLDEESAGIAATEKEWEGIRLYKPESMQDLASLLNSLLLQKHTHLGLMEDNDVYLVAIADAYEAALLHLGW
jgi:hypothetical protein